MKRITSFSVGTQVPSATLNSMQDYALSLLLANVGNDFGSSQPLGSDGLVWQANASVSAATLVGVDTGDWHDRFVWGSLKQNRTATDRIGGTTDYNYDSVVDTTWFQFEGYLGKGGYSTTGGVAVSNGNPPTRGAGAVTSWFVNCASAAGAMCLYVDPSTFKLYLYNNSGFATQPTLRLHFSAATGKRP